jgi:hypothetical protein
MRKIVATHLGRGETYKKIEFYNICCDSNGHWFYNSQTHAYTPTCHIFICETRAISTKKNIFLMIIADNEVSRDVKDVDLLNYVEMDPQISF